MIPRSIRLFAFLIPLAPLLGCAGPERRASEPLQPVLESSEMGSMHNVSVSGDIWMGSCPNAGDLDLAARRGIERVVDVRSAGERKMAGEAGRELAGACKELGLELVEVEVPEDLTETGEEAVDRVLALLAQSDAKTLLLCRDGRRSAVFFAIHRVINEGVSIDDALLEARRCGMPAGRDEDFLRSEVERLGGS